MRDLSCHLSRSETILSSPRVRPTYVLNTVVRARGGDEEHLGYHPKNRQARGGAHVTSGFTAAIACPRWGHHPELSSVATADAKLVVATADAKNASPRRLMSNASVIGIHYRSLSTPLCPYTWVVLNIFIRGPPMRVVAPDRRIRG